MLNNNEILKNVKSPASQIFHPRLAWMLYYKQVKSVAKVCDKFGISSKTFYKWWNRYNKSGCSQNSLQDESRKPHTSPHATPENIVKKVIEAKMLTGYGQRRLRNYLIENHNIILSEHTIWKLLKQNLGNDKFPTINSLDIKLLERPGDKVILAIYDVSQYLNSFPYALYTAVDSATHLRISKIYSEPTSENTLDFFQLSIERFPFKIKELIIPDHPACKNCNPINFGMQPSYQEQSSNEDSFFNKILHLDEECFFKKYTFASFNQLQNLYNKYLNDYNNHKMQPSLNNLTPLQTLRKFYEFKSLQYFEHL